MKATSLALVVLLSSGLISVYGVPAEISQHGETIRETQHSNSEYCARHCSQPPQTESVIQEILNYFQTAIKTLNSLYYSLGQRDFADESFQDFALNRLKSINLKGDNGDLISVNPNNKGHGSGVVLVVKGNKHSKPNYRVIDGGRSNYKSSPGYSKTPSSLRQSGNDAAGGSFYGISGPGAESSREVTNDDTKTQGLSFQQSKPKNSVDGRSGEIAPSQRQGINDKGQYGQQRDKKQDEISHKQRRPINEYPFDGFSNKEGKGQYGQQPNKKLVSHSQPIDGYTFGVNSNQGGRDQYSLQPDNYGEVSRNQRRPINDGYSNRGGEGEKYQQSDNYYGGISQKRQPTNEYGSDGYFNIGGKGQFGQQPDNYYGETRNHRGPTNEYGFDIGGQYGKKSDKKQGDISHSQPTNGFTFGGYSNQGGRDQYGLPADNYGETRNQRRPINDGYSNRGGEGDKDKQSDNYSGGISQKRRPTNDYPFDGLSNKGDKGQYGQQPYNYYGETRNHRGPTNEYGVEGYLNKGGQGQYGLQPDNYGETRNQRRPIIDGYSNRGGEGDKDKQSDNYSGGISQKRRPTNDYPFDGLSKKGDKGQYGQQPDNYYGETRNHRGPTNEYGVEGYLNKGGQGQYGQKSDKKKEDISHSQPINNAFGGYSNQGGRDQYGLQLDNYGEFSHNRGRPSSADGYSREGQQEKNQGAISFNQQSNNDGDSKGEGQLDQLSDKKHVNLRQSNDGYSGDDSSKKPESYENKNEKSKELNGDDKKQFEKGKSSDQDVKPVYENREGNQKKSESPIGGLGRVDMEHNSNSGNLGRLAGFKGINSVLAGSAQASV